MKWNEHSKLIGKHARFSPSQPGWLKYDIQGMKERYFKSFAQQIGIQLHKFAEDRIKTGMRMRKSDKEMIIFELLRNGIPDQAIQMYDVDILYGTIMAYINDAIKYKLTPEQILFYSMNFYGTADAIGFSKNNLIIFDLKTGETPAHMEQLLIYAALFCLEYNYKPIDLNNIELRIYQMDEAIIFKPELSDIVPVIDHIKTTQKLFDKEAGEIFGL